MPTGNTDRETSVVESVAFMVSGINSDLLVFKELLSIQKRE